MYIYIFIYLGNTTDKLRICLQRYSPTLPVKRGFCQPRIMGIDLGI
jgi:hypothetical protein